MGGGLVVVGMVGFDLLMMRESRAADMVEEFAREGVQSVAVYAIKPVRREPPADAGDEEVEDYLEEKVTDEHFHQFPVETMTTLTNGAEARKVVRAVVAGMRRWGNESACFDPRHGLRIVSSQGKVLDVVLCFSCGWVEVWQAGAAGERWRLMRGATSEGAQKVIERALGRP